MISLCHPSRGRAQKAHSTVLAWMATAGVPCEHIISLDSDDPQIEEYKMLFAMPLINDNTCVVQAANHAAQEAKGDILIYLSDDFKCPENWGVLVEEQFKDVSGPLLIKVDDCLQRFGVDVLTIPIMNRQLYERLGYFFNPIYKSLFVDQDLYHVVNNMGALRFCPQLQFPHEHYCNGKAPIDETYKRSNLNWNEGKSLYARRKSEGFK